VNGGAALLCVSLRPAARSGAPNRFQALANELVALQLGLSLTARAVVFLRAVVREPLQLLLLPLPS
jgi:hypothetical protein